MSGQPTLIYVDDEPQALKYFSRTVGDRWRVLTAGSAAEAREWIASEPEQIRILITDQRMPEETGVQLLDYARTQHPHIVRILTTAYADLDSAIKAVNAGGAFWYVTKPWHREELLQVLDRANAFFEIVRERDELLRQKLSVMQHVIIADRARGLLLLAAALGQLGWRDTREAVARYVQQARKVEPLVWNAEDLAGLDFRDSVRQETEYLVDAFRRIHDAVGKPSEDEAGTVELRAVVQELAGRLGQNTEFEGVTLVTRVGASQVAVPREALITLIGIAVTRLANMDGQELEVIATIAANRNGEAVRLRLEAAERSWTDPQRASLFSAVVPSRNRLMGLDMDLLELFILARHHGVNIEVDVQSAGGPAIECCFRDHTTLVQPERDERHAFDAVYRDLRSWVEGVIGE